MTSSGELHAVRLVGSAEGEVLIDSRLAGFGVITKLAGATTGGNVCVVVHPLEPLALGAPRHTHRHEDEVSYVLEGHVMIEVGGEVYRAGPGDLVYKPNGVPHAFWNPGEQPARVLEIIAPGRFEAYFAELGQVFRAGPPDPRRMAALAERYGV